MNDKEFESVFSEELFNKIHKMIEEKKLSFGNIAMLLKHMGYWKTMKGMYIDGFIRSLLFERFEEMIAEEEKKKEEKNEKLLVDLCECYLLLSNGHILTNIVSIIVPCLLKATLNREENEETQKEVEMALQALSCIRAESFVEQKLYLNGMREIIQYHQEHHNLTRLAYYSVWEFLLHKLSFERSLKDIVANELHFAREARRELEELTRCVDWIEKDEDKRRKEKEEVIFLKKWIKVLNPYLLTCKIWNEELVGLMSCIVNVFGAAKENYREVREKCIESLKNSAFNKTVKVEDLLKSRAVDLALKIIVQFGTVEKLIAGSVVFFWHICVKLKGMNMKENDEAKRKEMKRMMFEKTEEEGYEDCIVVLSRCMANVTLQSQYYFI
ncbi:uncharacterized protein MONOS_18660 [Monocercomonoides exilis]|uniref:uncharacterized protein n=1 Tax=Monocercomonoides exilis TaxID=2049356 RepID=UPI00355AB76E|nr:hypothetical protein MONOS_18660 [Monocercomonoides exilis]